jgi:hypothetical protein
LSDIQYIKNKLPNVYEFGESLSSWCSATLAELVAYIIIFIDREIEKSCFLSVNKKFFYTDAF